MNKMFKHVSSKLMKRYLIEGLYGKKALDYKEFSNTIFALVKETDEDKKLKYLAEIFAEKEDTIKKKALKDFIEIFSLPKDLFGVVNHSLTKEEFLAAVAHIGVDLDQLLEPKPML